LNPRHYVGVDISEQALDGAWQLAVEEGWSFREPQFVRAADLSGETKFDMIWSFSVTIHLPTSEVEKMFRWCEGRMHIGSQFLCSYVAEKKEVRTGLKQFRHPESFYARLADKIGLTFVRQTDWKGEQRIALMKVWADES
jgi:2-polyprenyl-3-methyl-5-hydroxy-6-metoxy-1,4-benzoquinol methylase